MKNLVNKSIIHHKCHNFIGLYPKLPNLIIFGQIGYDNVGDSVFLQGRLSSLFKLSGTVHIVHSWTYSLSYSFSFSFSYYLLLDNSTSVYQKLQIIYNVSFTCKDYNNANSFRFILVQIIFAKIYEHLT